MKTVLVSGGFDPLHSGHIEYFKAAKKLGDQLVVVIHSDAWLERNVGKVVMPRYDRSIIIENLKMVDSIIVLFNDNDDTAIDAIKHARMRYPDDEIIFAINSDSTSTTIPEMIVPNILFKFGVGKEPD
jgi:cytidyltransferase-like protein